MWQQIKVAWRALLERPSRPALWYALRALFPIHYWHDNVAAHPPIGTWMWHIHHRFLAEQLIDYGTALEGRLEYIRESKPSYEDEQPWQTHRRLRLIDIVRNPPTRALELQAAEEAAKAALLGWKAQNKLNQSLWWQESEYLRVLEDHHKTESEAAIFLGGPEWTELHRVEHPGCPWNGFSIFPEVETYEQKARRIVS